MRVLLRMMSLLFRMLPLSLAYYAGGLMGWIWYYLIPIRKKVALANLKLALPKLSASQRSKIARRSYVNLARCGIEFLRMPGLTHAKAEKLVEFVGWQNIQAAALQGKGVIAVTAHFGNFDLMACMAALRGLPLHVLTKEQHQVDIQNFWKSVRSRFGLGFISVKDSVFKIHKLLRSNQVVAIVIDQHMPPGRGLSVPFFGKDASTTFAPALFAYLTGAPIIPVWVERLPGGRHRVTLEAAIEADRKSDRETEIIRLTTYFNRWLEAKIIQRPDHWLWIHRRWKL